MADDPANVPPTPDKIGERFGEVEEGLAECRENQDGLEKTVQELTAKLEKLTADQTSAQAALQAELTSVKAQLEAVRKPRAQVI